MKAVEEDAKERAKIKKRNEAEAEKLKVKGNNAFKEGQFTEAISHYTTAINKLNSNPVLYTNRAQVIKDHRNIVQRSSDLAKHLTIKKCNKILFC